MPHSIETHTRVIITILKTLSATPAMTMSTYLLEDDEGSPTAVRAEIVSDTLKRSAELG